MHIHVPANEAAIAPTACSYCKGKTDPGNWVSVHFDKISDDYVTLHVSCAHTMLCELWVKYLFAEDMQAATVLENLLDALIAHIKYLKQRWMFMN